MFKWSGLVLLVFSFNVWAQEPVTSEGQKEEEVEAVAEQAPVEAAESVEKPQPAKPVSKSEPKPIGPVVEQDTSIRPFKIGVALYYSFADKVDQEGQIHMSGSSFTFSAQDDTEAIHGIAISLVKKMDPTWSIEFGIGHEFERKVKSYSLTVNGVTTSGTYTDPGEFSMMSFFTNLRAYATPETYFIGGANVTKIKLEGSDVTLNTGFGGQVGIGHEVTQQFGIEILYRLIMAKGRASGVSNGTAVSIDYDDFELNGLMALARFSF